VVVEAAVSPIHSAALGVLVGHNPVEAALGPTVLAVLVEAAVGLIHSVALVKTALGPIHGAVLVWTPLWGCNQQPGWYGIWCPSLGSAG
jgi:hypothetical protein